MIFANRMRWIITASAARAKSKLSLQALPHAMGFESGLYARRGGALPGNSRKTRVGIRIHRPRNLVAVISNGTAVLGLGNIGASGRQARYGRQGRAVQALCGHRRFRSGSEFRKSRRGHSPLPASGAHLSAASIWRTSRRRSVSTLNKTLRKTMSIPVFHDDQHGTAIISGAALLNALEVVGKDIEQSPRGLQRRGRLRHRLRGTLRATGRAPRKHPALRHQGRGLRGPRREHESVQGALRRQNRPRARLPMP